MKRNLSEFNKAIEKMNAYKEKRKQLSEAVCGYIMVARDDFVFKVAEMIEKEEEKQEK